MTNFTRCGLWLTAAALALTLLAFPLDASVASDLHDVVVNRPRAVDALHLVSVLGRSTSCYVVCGLVSVHLLWRRRWQLAVYLCSTSVLGALINNSLKLAFGRDRPVIADPVASALGKSFPSGHAMAATVTYGALLLIVLPTIRPKRVAIAVTGSLVVLIGFTRVALGVHYASDVLGGFAAGTAWLVIATAALRRAAPHARL